MEGRFTPQGAETFTTRPMEGMETQQIIAEQPTAEGHEQVIFDVAAMQQNNRAVSEEFKKWEAGGMGV